MIDDDRHAAVGIPPRPCHLIQRHAGQRRADALVAPWPRTSVARRLTCAGATAGLLLGPLGTTPAEAHGLVGRTDLPMPEWLFAWAATIVLVASFVALSALWTRPRLQSARAVRLLELPRWCEVAAGAFGVAVFVAVVACGLWGAQVGVVNLAPTVVYVVLWVAVPLSSALVGDVFAFLNPWRAVARAVAWTGRGRLPAPPLRYPERLGVWPAAAAVVAFGFLELVYVDRDTPSALAKLAIAYAAVQLAGMALYGVERWSTRADAFGVAFSLYARLAPVEWRTRTLLARPPLSGLTRAPHLAGSVALVCAMIGVTTFDGASNGPLWQESAPTLQRGLTDLGIGNVAAGELTGALGLLLCVLVIAGLYRAAVRSMAARSPGAGTQQLASAFAFTLVPIAFGYLLAHYFSFVVYQAQALGFLISDPMGTGANLFGTASLGIDYRILSPAAIWYVQVAALVAGHVAGLALAHDRALVVFGASRAALRSQYWMLAVMVALTCLGLYLLSAVGT